MKNILVMSIHECLEYVVDGSDLEPHIIISIQDTQNGFGVKFVESRFCKGVLTLYFDDIIQETPGLRLFTKEQGLQIIKFLKQYEDINKIIIHCYAGESRSAAIASVLKTVSYSDLVICTKQSASPNRYVYNLFLSLFELVE